MNISSNNGVSASQVVMHSHIHFIPRFEGDGLKIATRNNAEKYTDEDYEKVAAAIRAQLISCFLLMRHNIGI